MGEHLIKLNDLIDIINDAIEVAVSHGGDYGGSYCCDAINHYRTMKQLADVFGVELNVKEEPKYRSQDDIAVIKLMHYTETENDDGGTVTV